MGGPGSGNRNAVGGNLGGGKKPGETAWRRKGAKEIFEAAAKRGVTPLGYLLAMMQDARQKYDMERIAPIPDQKRLNEYMELTVSIAEKAAPYCHSRLTAVTSNVEIVVPNVVRGPVVEHDSPSWSDKYRPVTALTEAPKNKAN